MKHDFNGDGKADILLTSPWGLGLLSLSANSLAMHTLSPNGTRFGGWLLNTADNNTEVKADFDGDGRAEILMSSPWGIGVLKLINGNLTSIAMAQNGTRLGGWVINTADNQLLHAADFDRDGKEEILVTSPWGIGILKYVNNALTSLMLAPNGTRFGGWLLNTADNNFTLVGDFDGDGQTEILVSSPWGLGILKFNGSTFISVAMVPNGTRCGAWTVNTATDRLEVVGDFDGDGKAEILVSNAEKIGILKLQDSSLSSLNTTNTGSRLGAWILNSATDKMNTVGDFDGDGKTEILVSSNWGIGVLKLNAGNLQTTMTAANGTRFGGWLLNTRDNRLNYAADFDADGRTEIQISSPWGMGILKQSGTTFNALMMAPNGTRFGGWLLNTADNDLECGLGQSYCLLIGHHDWDWVLDNTAPMLRNRGYTMYILKNGQEGIDRLKSLARNLKACDRLFVYLAGHGGTDRSLGDITKATSASHGIQFEDGAYFRYNEFGPSFQLLANKGIDLSVLDGSCEGGESVMYAMGEKYVAMAATDIHGPSLTNNPGPFEAMQAFGKPSRFGMWWTSQCATTLLTAKTVHRFHQKMYRNDNTDIGKLSLFYKSSLEYNAAFGSEWLMMVRYCYLFKYIYPEAYSALPQAEKDKMTGPTADFMALISSEYNDLAPVVMQLKNLLGNADLVNRAATIYVQSFPRSWQALFGDLNWNVTAEPTRRTGLNNPITPNLYTNTAGFVRMVNEILNLIAVLEWAYRRQEALLTSIDAEIRRLHLYIGIFKIQILPTPKVTDYLKYNEFYLKHLTLTAKIVNEMNVDRTTFFKAMTKPAEKFQKSKAFTTLIEQEFGQTALNERAPASLDAMIAELKNISVTSSVCFDKMFYLLIIVEEAISWAQSSGAESGDLVKY